ncbi:MAG TPA: hypothetical protein VMB26_16425 [Candidatus Binataceae bacterium]|nr:hypothetical protein [Candidatus Binataceae bacterium]
MLDTAGVVTISLRAITIAGRGVARAFGIAFFIFAIVFGSCRGIATVCAFAAGLNATENVPEAPADDLPGGAVDGV